MPYRQDDFFSLLVSGDEVRVTDQIGYFEFASPRIKGRLRLPISEGTHTEAAADLEMILGALNDALSLAGCRLELHGVMEADHPGRGIRLFRDIEDVISALDDDDVQKRRKHKEEDEPRKIIGDTYIFVFTRL